MSSGVWDRVAEEEELVPAELLRDRALDDLVPEVWMELPDALRWYRGADAEGDMAFGLDRLAPDGLTAVPHDCDW